MRPLFAYLLIATIGLSAVRCTIQKAPIYKRLEERQDKYDRLLEQMEGCLLYTSDAADEE